MPRSKERKKETEKATKSKSSSKEKKKKSSSRDRSSKSPTRSRKKLGADHEFAAEPEASTQRQPIQAAPPPPLPPEKDQTASSDFEAGLLFQRYDEYLPRAVGVAPLAPEIRAGHYLFLIVWFLVLPTNTIWHGLADLGKYLPVVLQKYSLVQQGGIDLS